MKNLYDITIGRFISEDPIRSGLNWYCYGDNNPVMYCDPTGLFIDKVVRGGAKLADAALGVFSWVIRTTKIDPEFSINAAEAGAFFLMMDQGKDGAYHASVDCWQQYAGYNDLYDIAFDLGTDMDREKFKFNSDGKDYVIWTWKGDYVNLGAGAELGIYSRMVIDVPVVGEIPTEHWLVDKELAIPMSLKLTDNKGNTIVDYNPKEKQWWVTGFNPAYQNVKQEDLTAVYTIDFSGNPKMYRDFKGSIEDEEKRWKFDSERYKATFTL